MRTKQNISGIHHITAVASSAVENLVFYEKILGLRLVKQTVNFDDPYTYHLYYGDARGNPGTIMTFFPWEKLPRGKPGAGMLTAVAFLIPRRSMDFWGQRLDTAGFETKKEMRFGDPVLRFSDSHGLPIELIGVGSPPVSAFWRDGPIGEEHAITGFHSATATLNRLGDTEALLKDVMGMALLGRENNRYRYTMENQGAPGHVYDVLVDLKAPQGRTGGGTFHHIAFRTDSDDSQVRWQKHLRAAGYGVTDVRDRNYFRSIYFHSPGGVLFEIATDPPGFTVDETPEVLGASLKLPARYEPMRQRIEGQLPRLRARPFRHIFKVPQPPGDDSQTLVTLHGTGGNEHDLIKVARQISPSSAILSPRGQVLENGMTRFFKRLAVNVFDEKDVVQRAHELADFVLSTTAVFGRDPDKLVALGYSNGANIAAAVVLLRSEVFSRAVLLRPMLPLQKPPIPDLTGKTFLILAGEHDTVIPAESTERLGSVLRSAGAEVAIHQMAAGHEITAGDLAVAAQWLSAMNSGSRDVMQKLPAEETT